MIRRTNKLTILVDPICMYVMVLEVSETLTKIKNKKQKGKKVMKINTQNRRHVIQTTTAGLSTQFVVPFAGVHRATTLTLRTGNRSLSLNGRQVRALREVLNKSTQLSRKTSTSKR